MKRAVLVFAIVLAPSATRAAAPPAVVFELADEEPIGVRIELPVFGDKKRCLLTGPVIFQGVLEKGKPIAVDTDAFQLCVSQTSAPFTKVDFGRPFLLHHLPGSPPIRVRLRSHPDYAGPTLVPTTPLVLELAGDAAIGVRVAIGTTGPCSASENVPLFSGILEPGKPIALATEAMCVCYERTYAPFVSAGWSAANVVCRPRICVGTYKCAWVTDLDAPFTLSLASHEP